MDQLALQSDPPITETTVSDGVAPSTVVVETVATVTDASPVELPPLSEAIDPDRLDGLFEPQYATGAVVFRYHGYTVGVGADRRIAVWNRDTFSPAE